MSQPLMAEIRLFAGNFAPRGWMFCWGQILSIAQNTALFSLLGTTYGGNGQTTFALPDLRGRVPRGTGQGPGISNIDLGEIGGVENQTLTLSQMPPHNHSVANTQVLASTAKGTLFEPGAGAVPASSDRRDAQYAPVASANTQLPVSPAGSTSISGSGLPISNLPPYLGMHYIIAVEGIFPSRN